MPVTSTFTDYTSTASGSGTSGGTGTDTAGYWSLERLKKSYNDYLTSKRDEINEQQDSRRYRHGAHWTADQIKVLNDRKQPVVTYNRIGRKVDGIVGLVEKLRQDPKAYPRTPKHEQGAELATAVIRYVLDEQDWKAKSPLCAEDGAVDGIGGIEIEITEGDKGDKEIGFEAFEPESFFYDPRSTRMDFSDARFMGLAKWVDVELAKEMFPDKAADIDASVDRGSELTTNSDKEKRWFVSTGEIKRIRLVDEWYRHKGEWCWCIYTGSVKLMEGQSYLRDEKRKTICKYVAFSASVDHDGDRYGFVRNLKSANDEINQRRSKGLHELNARRIIAEEGAFVDIEKTRKEAARPDGVVIRNHGFDAQFDDTTRIANMEGQLKFLEDAKAEIENFGPNPALIGQGLENQSGRAINLLQQAGIAELGPFILSYKGWKIRVYRALWNAVQQHWTAERWIRVTDDEGLAQFVGINQLGVGPDGMPAIVNAVGSLDVDIIMDEAPDQVNVMADTYEMLSHVVPSIAPMLKPQEASLIVKLLIDTSSLPGSTKKQFRDGLQQASQPDPQQEQAKQVALAGESAKVDETKSKTMLNVAKAHQAAQPEAPQMPQPQEPDVPVEVKTAGALADIAETHARTRQHDAQAAKAGIEAAMVPMKVQHDAFNAAADRDMRMKQFQARPAQGNSP